MAKWKKGNSGNPKGRPKGRDSHSATLRKILQERSEDLINKVIQLGLAGDIAALKLCLERLCPILKPQEEPIVIDIASGSFGDQGKEIIKALANGNISSKEASMIIGVLHTQASLLQFTEMVNSIEELKEIVKSRPNEVYDDIDDGA